MSVSTRSSVTNSTYAARLQPSVATNTDSRSGPRRMVAQSTCACSPGSVSKRTAGPGVGDAFNPATNTFTIVYPPA
jgi:hypothetical protein